MTNVMQEIIFIIIFIIGMLSKSKGQILRVAATFHVLFHIDNPGEVTPQISEEAIAAAITFVGMCCQQTALAGRQNIKEEITVIKASKSVQK